MSAEDQDEWEPDLESSTNSNEIEERRVLGAHALYLGCEKGWAADYPGGTFTPCSLEFLQTLIEDLRELSEYCISYTAYKESGGKDFRLDHNKVEDWLAVIGDEINRLDKHSELFPSEDVRLRFFHYVHRILCTWNAAVDKLETMGMEQEDKIKETVTMAKHRTRSAYTVDRTPWQQWLHNKAPGSGVHTREMDQEGSTQLVPFGAFQIFRSWNSECLNIMKEIDPTHEGPKFTITVTNPGDKQPFRQTRQIPGPMELRDMDDEFRDTQAIGKPEKLAELNFDYSDIEEGGNRRRLANMGKYLLVHEFPKS